MHHLFLSSMARGRHRVAMHLIAACALFMGAIGLFDTKVWAQTAPVKRGEPITLNFSNADIEAVARTMATLTGRNVVVDPRVKGNITLTTDTPASPARAYNLFLATLRMQGFTVVQVDGIDKVVPEADAKLQGGGVSATESGSPGAGGNQLVTQIIKLQYENANNLVAVLRPLINPNNPINVNPATNSLVITDYADNLRRLARVVAALDVPNATDVEVIPIKHANASDLAPLVLRLLESSGTVGTGQADASFKTAVLAEPRSNALIVRAANQARLALARSLISKLDQPTASDNGAAGNIYVVYLKNANATQLATTLRAAISSEARAPTTATPAASGTGAAASTAAANVPSTGGQIQADPTTNSLIITASEPQYRQLRAVIDKLDARRAQVYVESLIAEVSADKAAEFGIQWQGALGNAGDGVIGLLGTNFGSGGKNIISLATQGAAGTVSPSRGFNLGAATKTNGVYVLGFLARFLEESGSGNVLSTPNLLTLDNEEAKIVIGQNVPFVTGQFTNTGSSSGTVNPFQTIERKDVGLTLKVKPQISENGTVKLAIYQEVSSVLASTANATNGPTTNKRTIESNVLVEDGAVVVLGGLLQDEYAGNQEKVPGLGDVPFFGNLFKSESRSRKKTNLMVFLRPVVVRDAAAVDRLSNDRYELMRSGQLNGQPEASTLVPINEAPVLPALQTRPAPPAAPTPSSPQP
ncbi:type II secretion system secretin GspD [Rhodoferax saidenbachensis]|uniref:General secretion pathway protein D n=1 Tax=Rhodoferax saidenbachensis TaxID=1484693 RepID=A0ABU1ZRL2_9BURK|nr:type II secretion system secretin GspD [Rhodoferax saidenbachensis]MDR7308194.1 general secretion pathway protein D [Rhodoferax saidenbachensis]